MWLLQAMRAGNLKSQDRSPQAQSRPRVAKVGGPKPRPRVDTGPW